MADVMVHMPGQVAPKPLFRDPVHDGAADPVMVWNRAAGTWFMFYTNRRANVPGLPGVAWVHRTRIGIAESRDGGATWHYRGTAHIDYGSDDDTHWAPDIVFHDGVYHMFLTFVPGTHTTWDAPRRIVHLKSRDLQHWSGASELKLISDRVIDAAVLRMPDGTWRMWYNDERDHKSIRWAKSRDLNEWTDMGKVVGDMPGEGPKVFLWHGTYWLIVDHWKGLGVYRSDDAATWTRQERMLLADSGSGDDDQGVGHHADVLVSGDRAYLLYFTHPGRSGADAKKDEYEQRRSSIQVVELEPVDGQITCDRNRPVQISLQPPLDAA